MTDMCKLLLVTSKPCAEKLGGRELLVQLNREILAEILGSRLLVFEVPKKRVSTVLGITNAFFGHIDGVNAHLLHQILLAVEANSVTKVFIDGSNFGEVAWHIKRYFPLVEVISFFHNVEARFFLGSFRHNRTLRSFAIMLANYLAERKAAVSSDQLICLSDRDSRLLSKLYGRAATHVAPIALKDRMPEKNVQYSFAEEKFALFVGSMFYANLAGIVWFMHNVAPHTNMKTYVVGHGLEKLKDCLELPESVELVGSVENLAPWYHRAHIVVAPILDGSGMKTKVAEALMFGKRIIGTPEAFSGYEDVSGNVGTVCRTADEFIQAINCSIDLPLCPFNHHLRAIYQNKYSYPAARERLRLVLDGRKLPMYRS